MIINFWAMLIQVIFTCTMIGLYLLSRHLSKEKGMELPQTKYVIGEKLYLVKGMQCFPFTVCAINFVMMDDKTIQYNYMFDDPVSKKVIRGQEPELYASFEEAKAVMSAGLEKTIDTARKQLEECKDPYTLPEESKA